MTWLPALITGGLALLGGLSAALLSHRSVRTLATAKKDADHELAERQADAQRRLARLEHLLSDETAKATARRAYEYDALKRLYSSVRPLLFQLGELCEASNRRIDKIITGTIRLSPESTSIHTTAYRIAAPIAVVRSIRHRLTTVDLRLDPVLRNQYLVARELLFVLRNGDELSSYPPALPDLLADKAPQQHITVRQLDGLVESLVSDTPGNEGELRSFFEFERECCDDSSLTSKRVGATIHLLSQAHPHGTPVLWRALTAQRLLQIALLRLLATDDFPASPDSLPRPSEEPYASAYKETLDVANAYLQARNMPAIS